MTLVDFHCHLSEAGGYQALSGPQSLFDAPKVVAVTNRPSDWKMMAGPEVPPGVTWAIGLHPELPHGKRAVADFTRLVAGADAIGEVGLDYSANARTDKAHQRLVFDAVLRTPQASTLLVSIHSRGATIDVVEALNDHDVPGAILHWFLGSDADVERALDADAYFSVNEAMLSSQRGRRTVDSLPPNRVVLETDAPYGGSGRGDIAPADLRKTVSALSARWRKPPDETEALIKSNQGALLSRVRAPTALTDL